MFFNISDINLYYEKYGTKKQVIFILPGWGDNRKTFYYLISTLKQYFTIYIIDYPGFGNSTFNKDLTIYDYAFIINELINYLNIKNPIIIAHSFGGRITSILLSKYKITSKKILLIDVAGINTFNLKLYLKTKIYKILKLIKYILPVKLKIKYQKYLFNKFASNDYQNLEQNLYKTFQNIIHEDLKKYYQNIQNETLILWGTKDNITPLKIGLKLNKLIKNSTLIKILNAQHFPYLEKPFLTNQIIYHYIKKDII